MTTTNMTLKPACEKYTEHLKTQGKSKSTVGTVSRILDLLLTAMGEEKEVGKILPVHVASFFKSEAATMQKGKDGMKPRAEASILQIRRVVRMALVWFHEQDWLASVPLPADEKVKVKAEAKTSKPAKPKVAKKEHKKAVEAAAPKETTKPTAPTTPAKPKDGETVATIILGGKKD